MFSNLNCDLFMAQLWRVLRKAAIHRSHLFLFVYTLETIVAKPFTINEPVTFSRIGCMPKTWISLWISSGEGAMTPHGNAATRLKEG